MANKDNMEALDQMLRGILKHDLPFGGITVFLVEILNKYFQCV